MTFGERVKQLREERKMRPSYLAMEARTQSGVIYSYENESRIPRIDMFMRLCEAFEITPNEFLEGVKFN